MSQVSSYADLISRFQSIGLLTDLKYTVDNNDNLRFIRLCIARAEVYRLETLKRGNNLVSNSSSFGSRSIDDIRTSTVGGSGSRSNKNNVTYQNNNVNHQNQNKNSSDPNYTQHGNAIEFDTGSDERDNEKSEKNNEEYEKAIIAPSMIISLNDLPIGPLENIEFRHNDVLRKHFHNEVRKKVYNYC